MSAHVKDAFSTSVTLTFAIGTGMMLLALVATFFLREIPLTGRVSAARIETTASEAAQEPVAELMM